MKVVITAPSLNENENVSGISTLIREIAERSPAEFAHFEAGRKDGEQSGLSWFVRQPLLPFRFYGALQRTKPDVVHINTAFIKLAILRDAALVLAARLAGFPTLLHIHGGPFVMGEFDSPVLAFVAKQMVRMSKRLVVFSEKEKASLAATYPQAEISILPNAISLQNAIERKRNNVPRTIVFLGRLNRSKGLDHIVDACRQLADEDVAFKFMCYGAGPERTWFLSEMTHILGERFSYGGIVGGAEKWKVLADADIFFLPSRDEGLPFALLEAMAAGCVPVMSESGGVATVIEQGRNGFLIEPGNTNQMAAQGDRG